MGSRWFPLRALLFNGHHADTAEGMTELSDQYLSSLTAEGRYRLLVEGVTDYAIYMLDPNGIVSSWNAGAQRFKGYEASETLE